MIEKSFSIPPPAWEHHLPRTQAKTASDSSTTRFFNRSRRTRRVLIDCFITWTGTALTCAGLAGVMIHDSSREQITQTEKYRFNATITGLSILLGLSFAAQFKQYCEMLRELANDVKAHLPLARKGQQLVPSKVADTRLVRATYLPCFQHSCCPRGSDILGRCNR